MSGRNAEDYAEDYTEPELRESLKEQIKASDRGGAPGRWSARKSQLLTREYERAGGGYRHRGEPTRSQESLKQWGEQDWQTEDGDGEARDGNGTRRYLPRVAWALLSKTEREATGARKRDGDAQSVANTEAARDARKAADLLALNADEAVREVRRMESASALDRARAAETEHGKRRKTVLEAIERRRRRLG